MITMANHCGHVGTVAAGTCKACGKLFCRDCGSPQVVRVRKTQWVQVDGRPPDQVWSEFAEVWPLCHACAAKMPPVWAEPAPPPPVTIGTKVVNGTNTFDWQQAIKILDALKLPAYKSFPKEPAKGFVHEWGTYGESPVQKLLKQEQAKQPKPPKPKRTPQSVLEADVEQFLREQDDD